VARRIVFDDAEITTPPLRAKVELIECNCDPEYRHRCTECHGGGVLLACFEMSCYEVQHAKDYEALVWERLSSFGIRRGSGKVHLHWSLIVVRITWTA